MITPFEIVLAVGCVMFGLGIFLGEEIKQSVAIKIGDDWKVLLRYAWSVRLIIIAAILSGLEAVLPIIGYRLPVSNTTLALINFVVVMAALFARFVAQEKIDS